MLSLKSMHGLALLPLNENNEPPPDANAVVGALFTLGLSKDLVRAAISELFETKTHPFVSIEILCLSGGRPGIVICEISGGGSPLILNITL